MQLCARLSFASARMWLQLATASNQPPPPIWRPAFSLLHRKSWRIITGECIGNGLAIHFGVPALRCLLQPQTDSEAPALGSGEDAPECPTIVIRTPFVHRRVTLQKRVAFAFCSILRTLLFEMHFYCVPTLMCPCRICLGITLKPAYRQTDLN